MCYETFIRNLKALNYIVDLITSHFYRTHYFMQHSASRCQDFVDSQLESFTGKCRFFQHSHICATILSLTLSYSLYILTLLMLDKAACNYFYICHTSKFSQGFFRFIFFILI